MPSGYGELFWDKNTADYKGDFIKGRLNGTGKLTVGNSSLNGIFSNGDFQSGDWFVEVYTIGVGDQPKLRGKWKGSGDWVIEDGKAPVSALEEIIDNSGKKVIVTNDEGALYIDEKLLRCLDYTKGKWWDITK